MDEVMTCFIAQFPFMMTIFSLILGALGCFKQQRYPKLDRTLGYLFFFAVGLSGIWGFIFHAFFSEMAAHFIGWANSPFQFEVAVANLGMGLVGIFGLSATRSYRIAGTLFTTCFLWGAAYGHVVQMIKADNFASGNAGLIFYNDIILPLLLIVMLLLQKKQKS